MSSKDEKHDDKINQDGESTSAKCSERRPSSPQSDTSIVSISSTNSRAENDLNFVFCDFVKEKRKTEIWGIEFNPYLKTGGSNVFVTMSGTQYSIYECNTNGKIKLLQCFKDPAKNEDFYTGCWSVMGKPLRPVLITAGVRGVIRIVEPNTQKKPKSMIGHGGAVNRLKISPVAPFLLASASRDRSIRLWNIETKTCIAILAGEPGHTDDVVDVDFHRDGSKLVSGGVDHMIAIWDLTVPNIVESIQKSKKYDVKTSKDAFETVSHHFPIFSTLSIHKNYVDCVEWNGDHIISKSNMNDMFYWMPNRPSIDQSVSHSYTIFVDFNIENCGYFFMRFAQNRQGSILAVGSSNGSVELWNLQGSDFDNLSSIKLNHATRKKTVRDLSFSRCGRDLIFCVDNGSIYLYQHK